MVFIYNRYFYSGQLEEFICCKFKQMDRKRDNLIIILCCRVGGKQRVGIPNVRLKAYPCGYKIACHMQNKLSNVT